VNNLQDIVTNILALRKERVDLSTTLQSKQRKESDMIALLRDRIRNGDSTGDHITDFMIARHGIVDTQSENVYRELEAKLEGRVGELTLVARAEVKKEHSGPTNGPFGRFSGTGYIERGFLLGVLTGDTLSLPLQNANINSFLRTGAKHVLCPSLYREHVELCPSDTPLDSFLDNIVVPVHLNKPLDVTNVFASLRPQKVVHALEVVVGNDAVSTWFEEEGAHALLLFREAARLLGRTVPESPILGEEIRRRTDMVWQTLTTLVAERDSLKRQLARINSSQKRGTYSPDGVSITVCESADDAVFIGFTQRERLTEVERRLKNLLTTAYEKGFVPAQDTLFKQLCTEYGITPP
jgi:hypothetical protein